MFDVNKIDLLKFNLQERRFPFFEDEELNNLLLKNNGDVDAASYEGLILKAENTGMNVSGVTTKDSASYFKMLASHFVKTNSGVLK